MPWASRGWRGGMLCGLPPEFVDTRSLRLGTRVVFSRVIARGAGRCGRCSRWRLRPARSRVVRGLPSTRSTRSNQTNTVSLGSQPVWLAKVPGIRESQC